VLNIILIVMLGMYGCPPLLGQGLIDLVERSLVFDKNANGKQGGTARFLVPGNCLTTFLGAFFIAEKSPLPQI